MNDHGHCCTARSHAKREFVCSFIPGCSESGASSNAGVIHARCAQEAANLYARRCDVPGTIVVGFAHSSSGMAIAPHGVHLFRMAPIREYTVERLV